MASEGLSISLEYVKCDLCGEDNSQVLCHKKSTRIGEWFNIVKCKNCGLIYVNPRLSKEEAISLAYGAEYFSHPSFEMSRKSDRYRDHRARVSRYAKIQGCSPGDRLLDLGCGAGHLLMAAKELRYDVFGVDISPTACQLCRSQGLPVYCGEIIDDYFSKFEGSFAIITALELLEHLYEPKRCLKRIYQLLRPGGFFFYTTGNAQRMEIEGSNWTYLHPESHIYYFTPTAMQAYFNEIGFEALDPYEDPPFPMLPITPRRLFGSVGRWILLRCRFLRFHVLRPYLIMRRQTLMPMARRPLAK